MGKPEIEALDSATQSEKRMLTCANVPSTGISCSTSFKKLNEIIKSVFKKEKPCRGEKYCSENRNGMGNILGVNTLQPSYQTSNKLLLYLPLM